MHSDSIRNTKPLIKLFYFLFVLLVSYLSITFLSIALALPLFGFSWNELSVMLAQGLENADINLIRYFQVSQSIGLFIIPGIILNYIIFTRDDQYLIKKSPGNILIYLLIFGVMIFSIPVISKLIEWNNAFHLPARFKDLEEHLRFMEDQRNELTIKMLAGVEWKDLFFNLFMVAILPALGEEMIFRGILQQLLIKWLRNKHVGIILAALLFSSIHMQFYGFIPRFILGVLFGYLFFLSKNLWWSIWAHFVNNALAVLVVFLTNSERLVLPDIFKEDYFFSIWEFGLGLILTSSIIGLLIFLHRKQNHLA